MLLIDAKIVISCTVHLKIFLVVVHYSQISCQKYRFIVLLPSIHSLIEEKTRLFRVSENYPKLETLFPSPHLLPKLPFKTQTLGCFQQNFWYKKFFLS